MFHARSCSRDDHPPYDRGQGLIEFVLVLPVALLILLGGIEAANLLVTKQHQDRATGVVADWAAAHPGNASWSAIAAQELPACTVTVDDTHPGITTAGATCSYSPIGSGLFQGLPISSEESAATATVAP